MEVSLLREFVPSFCGSCKVVAYLRRQDKLAVSLYSTRFRAGATELSAVFPTDASEFYDYDRILTQFAEVFGKENVIVRLFDKSEFVGNDLIADFCGMIGLPVDETFRRPGVLNQPLKPEAIRLFAEFNKHIPRFVDGRPNPDFTFVLNAFDSLFCGHGPIVDRASAKQFCEKFKEGNERIRRAFFPSRESPLFDEDFNEYPEVPPSVGYSYEDAVRLSADLLRFMIRKVAK